MYPTLIRLPGYPLFLAAVLRLFGMENYFAAACVQIALDLLGCLLLAGFRAAHRAARASRGRRAGHAVAGGALPVYRFYTAAPLDRDADALCAGAGDVGDGAFQRRGRLGECALVYICGDLLPRCCGPTARWRWCCAGTFFWDSDGIGAEGQRFFFWSWTYSAQAQTPEGDRFRPLKLTRMAVVCVLLALAPFAVWTARNWRVFHVFEPLAPRLATDPGESTNPDGSAG
jgi:hypothetical protein